MTTESVPAPHTTRATAATVAPAVPATTALHPPRGTRTGRAAAPPRIRHAGRRGPLAGLVAVDVLALVLTTALLPPLPWPVAAFALLALAQPLVYACRGLYRPTLSPSALYDAPALCGLALVQWFAVAEILTAHDPRHAVGWREPALAVLVQTALCCGGRALLHRARRRSAVRRPDSVLVVGRGPVAQQITAALYARPEYGMRPVGQVDTTAPAPDTGLPVLATRQDVGRAVIQNSVRHAVFAQPPGPDPEMTAVLSLLARHGCRLWLVDGGATTGNGWRRTVGHDHLWGFSVQPLRGGPHRPVARAVKRAIDTLVSALALAAAAPVLAVCALAVRIADGPGVIFRQERVGLDGRPFTLLKFRTLAPANEHESATRWNVAFDRRISATGSLLRRTSLDELPQLWNVLRGDMSLVGPRPERPYFVDRFSRVHPGYQARHRMPVGITGLAQIHGLRGDTSIEERARFDNHYIETWSPWRDVCILARTAASLFRLGGS
ncbi:exopolysaccharide biosynthesis polyprenyl glycosylphosphotransferase [Streptomyces sp. NPDC020965]|uniref:exopolysaccharide biosynthesis polyprenyl glycosylphosphotransferase n=1 Tax=Streptomyces sp. NPDC020965 TaxID=3365105 RepID=UPI0037A30664